MTRKWTMVVAGALGALALACRMAAPERECAGPRGVLAPLERAQALGAQTTAPPPALSEKPASALAPALHASSTPISNTPERPNSSVLPAPSTKPASPAASRATTQPAGVALPFFEGDLAKRESAAPLYRTNYKLSEYVPAAQSAQTAQTAQGARPTPAGMGGYRPSPGGPAGGAMAPIPTPATAIRPPPRINSRIIPPRSYPGPMGSMPETRFR